MRFLVLSALLAMVTGKNPVHPSFHAKPNEYKGNNPRIQQHSDYPPEVTKSIQNHLSKHENIPQDVKDAAIRRNTQVGKATFTAVHVGGQGGFKHNPDPVPHVTARYHDTNGNPLNGKYGASHFPAKDIPGAEKYDKLHNLPHPGSGHKPEPKPEPKPQRRN